MKRQQHQLKLREEYADAVLSGEKNFEIRYNDRDYHKGDLIYFRVIDKYGNDIPEHKLNGREFEITYVLADFGLQDNFVALGIMQTPFRQKPKPIEGYICDPRKNKECRKTACYARGGPCRITLNPEYARGDGPSPSIEIEKW